MIEIEMAKGERMRGREDGRTEGRTDGGTGGRTDWRREGGTEASEGRREEGGREHNMEYYENTRHTDSEWKTATEEQSQSSVGEQLFPEKRQLATSQRSPSWPPGMFDQRWRQTNAEGSALRVSDSIRRSAGATVCTACPHGSYTKASGDDEKYLLFCNFEYQYVARERARNY